MKTTRITVGGKSFLTDDLTLNEAEAIEKATGESWLSLTPYRSAVHCREIMRAFLLRDHSEAEAEEILSGMTVSKALDAVEVVDDDLPEVMEDGRPKAEGAASTRGSSTAPDPLVGLPT